MGGAAHRVRLTTFAAARIFAAGVVLFLLTTFALFAAAQRIWRPCELSPSSCAFLDCDIDTDGDGVPDREEDAAAVDGVVTNARDPDTDHDGAWDGVDPCPLEADVHAAAAGVAPVIAPAPAATARTERPDGGDWGEWDQFVEVGDRQENTDVRTITDDVGSTRRPEACASGPTKPVWDTDGDGVPDHDERATGTDPGASDTDGDALSDLTDLCPLAREGGGADAPEDRDGDGVPDRCVSGHPLVPRWWERDPVVHKYACWLQNLAAGRAGTAEKYQGVPLVDLVRRSFVETAILIAFSMMLAGACALPVIALGYVLRRRRAVTRAIDGVFSLLSVPIVLVGYVLGALVNSTDFSVFATFDADVRLACTDVAWIRYDLVLTDARCGANYLLHLLLPALVLAVGDGNLGHFVRDMGQNLDDVSGRLFMRYARVRGIGPWRLALRYLLKNVMVPALTFLRYRLVFLLSGALVVEVMFDRKGMGRLMLNAINEDQDVPTFLACVLAFLVLVFVVQVAVRIAQTAIDRRLAQ